MKKVLKATLVLTLVLLMALSSLIIVSAEETTSADDEIVITNAVGGGTASPQAFDLVWKYRYYNGVLQKRRWNKTLDEWYDPYWINVN